MKGYQKININSTTQLTCSLVPLCLKCYVIVGAHHSRTTYTGFFSNAINLCNKTSSVASHPIIEQVIICIVHLLGYRGHIGRTISSSFAATEKTRAYQGMQPSWNVTTQVSSFTGTLPWLSLCLSVCLSFYLSVFRRWFLMYIMFCVFVNIVFVIFLC